MEENKYPYYIMEKLRQRRGLEEDDTSSDKIINEMDEETVFDECCNWDGLTGWGYALRQMIQDIYKVDLDKIVEQNINDRLNQ